MDTTSPVKVKRDAGKSNRTTSKLGIGVSLDSSRPGGKVYKVRVYHKGKCLNLGRFDDLLKAQICYDQAVVSMTSKGCKKVNTNFPLGTYPLDDEDVQRKVDEFLARLEAKSDAATRPQQPEIAGRQVNSSPEFLAFHKLPDAFPGGSSSSSNVDMTEKIAVPSGHAALDDTWMAAYAANIAAAPHPASSTTAAGYALDDAPLPPAAQDEECALRDTLMWLSSYRQGRISNSSTGDRVALHMLGQLVQLLAQDACAAPLPAAAGASSGAFVNRYGALLAVEKLTCALTNLNDVIRQAPGQSVDTAACQAWLRGLQAARVCPADEIVLQLAMQLHVELTG
eukprot:gene12880-13006_t